MLFDIRKTHDNETWMTSSCAIWNGLRIGVGDVAILLVSLEDRSVIGLIRLHHILYDILIGLE